MDSYQDLYNTNRALAQMHVLYNDNLNDITFRALETFKSVDLIASEDTRHTQGLLSHFSIEKKQFAVHQHNEKASAQKIIEYLKDVLDSKEISSLCSKLNLTPGQLIRTGEGIYKENYSQKELSDSESIEAMVAHPILIERPIVVCNSKAAIGRPPENVLTIL